MTKQETTGLYDRTLQALAPGRKPTEGELDAWLNVLGNFSYADLDAALRRWQNDTRLDEFTQRPRGSRMPTATELKLSIETFDNAHKVKFQACNQNGCEGGWIREFTGRTVGADAEGCDPQPVHPRIGSVRRCPCFYRWAAANRKAKSA